MHRISSVVLMIIIAFGCKTASNNSVAKSSGRLFSKDGIVLFTDAKQAYFFPVSFKEGSPVYSAGFLLTNVSEFYLFELKKNYGDTLTNEFNKLYTHVLTANVSYYDDENVKADETDTTYFVLNDGIKRALAVDVKQRFVEKITPKKF